MIKSRQQNQIAVHDAISEFILAINSGFVAPGECPSREDLLAFTKVLAKHLLRRTGDNDCYFIDMLEDIEQI